MAEERKGAPIEKWDEVNGRSGDEVVVMQDAFKANGEKSVGERFIEMRESTGMSRKDFAEYLNIPYRTMTDWERDLRTMPEYVFALIEYKVSHDLGKQMRNIEDAVEQNDNSLDGVINNLPQPDETEKARESVLQKLKEREKATEEERSKLLRVPCQAKELERDV